MVSKQHFEPGFLNQRWHIHGTLHVLQGFFCCNSSMIVLSWKSQSWLFTKKTCPNVPSHVTSARTFEETKPAKFVKIIWLIDPIRWLLVPIMGSWIQVDGCSLHGYDHPFFGLYRPGVARKVVIWWDQGGWSYSELEGGFTIDYEYFTLRPK